MMMTRLLSACLGLAVGAFAKYELTWLFCEITKWSDEFRKTKDDISYPAAVIDIISMHIAQTLRNKSRSLQGSER